jgi:fimbrial chaperone protein
VRLVRLFACAGLVASLACALVHAGSFMANPIRLVVPAGANATSLTLENTGGEPVLVQAEVLAWSQADGKDVLTPSEDLVVSPPIFKVAAGASQIVRVGVVRRNAGDRELTYRVFLQEVPEPPAPGAQGVNVALRLGLPVFVMPRANTAPQLAWRAVRDPGGVKVTVTNSGNAHAQLIECRVVRENGTVVAEQPLAAYVLPGSTRSWVVKTGSVSSAEKLRLSVQTAGGLVSADITGP